MSSRKRIMGMYIMTKYEIIRNVPTYPFHIYHNIVFSLEYRCQLEKRCKKQPPGSLIEADASKGYSPTQRKRPLEPKNRLRTAAAERAALCHCLTILDQRESIGNQRQSAREPNAITNFTRQPRSRHSAGGNAEVAARGAKRNP